MEYKLKIAEGYLYVDLEGGERAFARFAVEDGRLYVVSTFVPEKHRGRGVAGELLSKLVEFSKANKLEVVPLCSYAVSFFLRNREAREVLAEPYKSMSDEELRRLYEERRAEEDRRRSLRLEERELEASRGSGCPVCG